jgi:DNA-binding transcriptional regulator YhcF (GntR family)
LWFRIVYLLMFVSNNRKLTFPKTATIAYWRNVTSHIMKILDRYKIHHQILTYLKREYLTHHDKEIDKYCFSPEHIASQLNSNIIKVEATLYELRENEYVNYDKNRGFKINDNGIAKQISKFYIRKQHDYLRTAWKDIFLFTTSILSICGFFIGIIINRSDKKERDELNRRIKKIELQMNPKKQVMNDKK